jgi:hypothetical protein
MRRKRVVKRVRAKRAGKAETWSFDVSHHQTPRMDTLRMYATKMDIVGSGCARRAGVAGW